MKKVIAFFRKNIKILIAFTLGLLTCSVGVYASIIVQGTDVGYTDTNSIGATTVQAAIDKLYELSRTKQQIKAWEYHESGASRCINGEEDTCVKTECYKSGSTCPQGTIIKYYVNNHVFHYFHVLRDDGSVITMQQRENTIRNIPWHAGSNDNSNGPDTILLALENATSTWTNVNILSYEPGVTSLFQNVYTGCTYNGGTTGDYKIVCNVNSYTMSERSARARMITALEASETGCLMVKDSDSRILGNSIDIFNRGSCPDYMHNYLYGSSSWGGSYDDNAEDSLGLYNHGYWTMSADLSNSTVVWHINHSGHLLNYYMGTSHTSYGARSVVEITKSNL